MKCAVGVVACHSGCGCVELASPKNVQLMDQVYVS